MYICVCVYMPIYMCVCVDMHTMYIHLYVCSDICVCVRVCRVASLGVSRRYHGG